MKALTEDYLLDCRTAELDETVILLDESIEHQTQRLLIAKAERNRLIQELKRRRSMPEPSVSNHALLRYLERVLGIDVEAIRAEILTPQRRDAIRLGARSIKVDGFKLCVKNNVVVTVLV